MNWHKVEEMLGWLILGGVLLFLISPFVSTVALVYLLLKDFH